MDDSATRGMMSVSQEQRLWFERLSRLRSRDVPPFHTSLTLRLSGPLDVEAARHAIVALVRRHEVFSLGFHLADPPALDTTQSPRKVSSFTRFAPLDIEFELQDISNVPEPHRSFRIHEVCSDTVSRPFDYSRPPLARVLLFRVGPCEHVLLFVLHHLISDGWSLRVLRREFEVLYEQCMGSGREVPGPGGQYSDFLAWQQERLNRRALASHIEYWRGHYHDWERLLVHVRQLPFNQPAPGTLRKDQQTVELPLDEARTIQVRHFATEHATTPYVVFLAALQTVLRTYVGRPWVGIMIHFANRARPCFDNLIGWCATRHVFTCRTPSNATATEMVVHTRDNLLKALAHQELPSSVLWRELVAKANNNRRVSNLDLGEFLTFDLNAESDSHVRDLHISPIDSHSRQVRTALALRVVYRTPTGVALRAKFAGTQFGERDIRHMVCDWRDAVTALADHPSHSLM
jgi:hypothetical protein